MWADRLLGTMFILHVHFMYFVCKEYIITYNVKGSNALLLQDLKFSWQ